ncbi:hypothetical protein RJT34_13958 [Clitoria ternatea]|uniref:Serine carboxypeptidase-like 19 n=1 Tax=Clitoria ternatea TaxID=43366 RepID=A0AAN9JRP8_CLITE
MAAFSSTHSACGILLLPLVVSSLICFQLASCGTIVEFLPGFDGPLPFVLETGYVGVGEGEDVQVFYYFVESENNPNEDPLMLWLTGGPGCSAFSGLALEIGPLIFKREEYNGGLPNLILRPHSWTKVSSIIFVDLPVSTGFTYARTDAAAQRSDWTLVHHAHEFLRKWLIDHPKFLQNELYIGGDSYSGIPIPVIVQEISQENEKGIQPWINLQGYILGNAITTRREKGYSIPFAHGMALISDELYESLRKNCKGEYLNVDPENVLCSRDIDSYSKATSRISFAHILERTCNSGDIKTSLRRSTIQRHHTKKFLNTNLKLPPLTCRTYANFQCGLWANDDNVRSALHIHKEFLLRVVPVVRV